MPAHGTLPRVCTVCLFFAATGLWAAEEARPPAAAADELRVVVSALASDNQRLKTELEQHETVIRLLTENLAIARTESELFQNKWSDAQLRAQTLGVNFADETVTHAQRQLVESVRALYLAEAERQRLIEQLQRLLDAIQKRGDVSGELARTKALLATSEQPASSQTGKTAAGTVESAAVLDVNPNLRLVVLNIGLLQGARVGMPMVVLRGDRVVAELEIVEVRRRICGALVGRTEKNVTLKAGDLARVTKSS